MSNIFITSDQHFWHKNILKFQKESGSRPFSDIQEMNYELIKRHNEIVGEDDEVWYLGDFGFCNWKQTVDILQDLNGIKHYIFGNHDKQMHHPEVAPYFETMQHYAEITVDSTRVVMFHYPIYSWNREHHGAIHLYGHTHNYIPFVQEGISKDIGCDANMCYPFRISDVIQDLAQIRTDKDLPRTRNARDRDGEAR